MRFIDYLRLAFKNLSRQKARTYLTITAITIGSLSVIIMFSLIIGIRQSLMDTFKEMDAFSLITVSPDPNAEPSGSLISTNGGPTEDGKKLDDASVADIKKIKNVIAVTPVGSVWAKDMKLEGQDKKMWASAVAYDPETKVFNMPISYGRNLAKSDMDKIVVGSRVVTTYGYSSHPADLIGQKIILNLNGCGPNCAPDWGDLPPKPVVKADGSWGKEESDSGDKMIPIAAEIIGIANNGGMDDSQNYINIDWARKLMTIVRWQDEGKENVEGPKKCSIDKDGSQKCWAENNLPTPHFALRKEDQFLRQGYSSIIAKVDDTKNLKAASESIGKLGFGVSTAQDMIDQINKVFLGVGLILGVIGGISLFVAAIGIINTMIMATYERIREIGVMRACGATRATIRRLFTFEAALLGFWGGVIGLVISIILIKVAKFIVSKQGMGDMNIPIDQIGRFPIWLIAGVIAFTTLVGLMSGLYPAFRAARLNPVDALRYE